MPSPPKTPARGDSPPLRDNASWIAALKGQSDEHEGAISDLCERLRIALLKTWKGPNHRGDVQDLVQESLARIVQNIDSFRGDSAFTTWATGIALRVGFTEARRRRVRQTDPDGFLHALAYAQELASKRRDDPAEQTHGDHIKASLWQAIRERLTDRQRTAIVAELKGIPTIEIAERMATNQNALYKLVHDARKRLREALEESGIDSQVVREYLEILQP